MGQLLPSLSRSLSCRVVSCRGVELPPDKLPSSPRTSRDRLSACLPACLPLVLSCTTPCRRLSMLCSTAALASLCLALLCFASLCSALSHTLSHSLSPDSEVVLQPPPQDPPPALRSTPRQGTPHPSEFHNMSVAVPAWQTSDNRSLTVHDYPCSIANQYPVYFSLCGSSQLQASPRWPPSHADALQCGSSPHRCPRWLCWVAGNRACA